MYLGCVRANDFLMTRKRFDGKTLGVTGGSQGGALSIITAGLDPRVKLLAAYYPALADVTGYLNGRAGAGRTCSATRSGASRHGSPTSATTTSSTSRGA